jgi:hypothetical protein
MTLGIATFSIMTLGMTINSKSRLAATTIGITTLGMAMKMNHCA